MHARANNVTVEVEDDNEDVDNPVILQVCNSTFVFAFSNNICKSMKCLFRGKGIHGVVYFHSAHGKITKNVTILVHFTSSDSLYILGAIQE